MILLPCAVQVIQRMMLQNLSLLTTPHLLHPPHPLRQLHPLHLHRMQTALLPQLMHWAHRSKP
nr:MAG TPA: hypothetical protein [Caudoviricetes sp.]